MKIKNIIYTFVALITFSSFISPCLTFASDEQFYDIDEDFDEELLFSGSYSNLPNSLDLSTSPCFPPIESQGNTGACTAFATAYYQFSYQVNMLNNVTSTNDRELFSPTWVYGLTCNGQDSGADINSAYSVLKDLGCLTLNTVPISSNYQYWDSYHVNEKIEALKTRVTNSGYLEISSNIGISSPSNLVTKNIPLSEVKSKLNDGNVLVVESKGYFDSGNKNGECVAFRCHSGSGSGHTMTIVGYDNFFTYDVNGNGTIETCERGAFKVANSWGTSFNQNGIFSSDGYFWVMYDALNKVSTNTYNNWESLYNTTRYPAFTKSNAVDSSNKFYYIDVAHKNVMLVGDLDIRTRRKFHLELKENVNSSNVGYSYGSRLIAAYTGENNVISDFTGHIIFDLTDMVDRVHNIFNDDVFYNGYYYFMFINGFDPTEGSNYANFSILDDLENTVIDSSTNDSASTAVKIIKHMNFDLGDIDYDGSVTSYDAQFIMQHISSGTPFSQFQKVLGDFNQDGSITLLDAAAIWTYVGSKNGSNLTLEESLENFIEEYGICNEDEINLLRQEVLL